MSSTQFWKGRRVLVTGGAGFIGSHLVSRLVRKGARVRVVDNLERGRLEYLGASLAGVELLRGDLRDEAVCRQACRAVDAVFHLASKVGGIQYYLQEAGEVFRVNTTIDNNVWSAALRARVPYYFYASSAHVYPKELQLEPDSPPIREAQALPANPELSYGWAKLFGERMILADSGQGAAPRAAIGRIIGAYGPNQSLELATGSAIPVFCRRAIEYSRHGAFTVIGTGRETRSYHFVSDTVEAMLRAVEKLEQVALVGPLNLGSEERISIAELVHEVIAISGKAIEIQWDTRQPTLIWGQVLDCGLARRLLDGWSPQVSLRQGLTQCYEHIAARLQSPAIAGADGAAKPCAVASS